ncbi:MAG: Re/Si-specific NAD(P)(+) transhydrogenase subunit alpha [Deltaproteobacteria bacterium]|nr:Re/Si-specific NAD(P)(+) transhydrogenase subunit alpha [Deltaproteobacteria bacterium]
MHIALLKETRPGESRVALVPESCKKLIQAGYTISIEKGAGEASFYLDEEYRKVDCTVENDPATLIKSADLILKVNPPTLDSENRNEIAWMKPGTVLLASLMPLRHLNVVQLLATHKITAFSTDAIPRTTRAQSMDTLSSMANIVGYKGVLIAASELSKYFPMFMTAAGTVFPAKVFVIGAAVAGLQAIATARRLGANVTATDVRPEVKEQIESLGAKYVGIELLKESAVAGGGYAKELSQEDKLRQHELLASHCATVDIVITTALIGGVFAPKLITSEIVNKMRPGSVIVDLGADGGGNCELSKLGERITTQNGVKIIAPLNLPSTMPMHASLLFSRNLTAFIQTFTKDKKFQLDLTDDIQKGSIITHNGEVLNARTKEALKSGGSK